MVIWDDVKRKNIPLDEIKKGSPEYEAMESAAKNGDMFAQHAMGLWNELVGKKIDEALKWYNKAANQGLDDSRKSYDDLIHEMKGEKI